MLRRLFAGVAMLFFFEGNAQKQEEIFPLGLRFDIYQSVPAIHMPAPDSLILSKLANQNSELTKSSWIAYNFSIALTPEKDGLKKQHTKNYETWFIKINSAGARGLALVFSAVNLLKGEQLYVYNLNGMIGGYTTANVPPSGILPLGFLEGEEIMVEYNMPISTTIHGSFTIKTVSHAFDTFFSNETLTVTNANKRIADERNCYVCMDWKSAVNKNSVVRIIVHHEQSTKLCTGTLMNNTAQDRKPYILTAEHCIANQDEADRSVFTFNYEYLACNQSVALETNNLYGAQHLSASYANDFSLVELYTDPPITFKPYYAGWDLTDSSIDDVTSIHHAQGGPKKISIFNDRPAIGDFSDGTTRAPDGFWKITQWDAGVTEGGSSGAPLFNEEQLVMGTLTGGSSRCGAPFNDYFQRLSMSWEVGEPQHQLKRWLDPLSSGAIKLKGLDPFEGINPQCDTVSTIRPDEPITLYHLTVGTGYFSGVNSNMISSYAEGFFSEDSAMVAGAVLKVGAVNNNASGGIIVSVHGNDNGKPGLVLYETYVAYKNINKESYDNTIQFYPVVNVKGKFFISYAMSYSVGDTFAVYQSLWRDPLNNTAYAKVETGWTALANLSPNGEGASLGISAFICKNDEQETPQQSRTIISYPNPATTVLVTTIPFTHRNFKIELFDFQGRSQPVNYQILDPNVIISLSSLSAGIYILRLSQPGKVFSTRFIKN